MWTASRVAVSGAQAQERTIETAANNLANLQSAGFKARRARLIELAPGTSVFSSLSPNGGVELATEGVGQGVALGGLLTTGSQGTLLSTGRLLDLAISGEGFLQVSLPDGRTAYTRDGSLQLDGQSRIVTSAGLLVAPGVTIPEGATDIMVSHEGVVTARVGSGPSQVVGRFELARFSNPEGLVQIGHNLLVATEAAGRPINALPGTPGFGIIEHGRIEASNVDVAEELTRVLRAQRAYQANLRAIRVVDEMLQEANAVR